jgi:hypothetical protein
MTPTLPQDLINKIYEYNPSHREKYFECMEDISKLEPSMIYKCTPCMYRVKMTKPFYGEVKIFSNKIKKINIIPF